MNGPSHYKEAERLIRDLPKAAKDGCFTHEDITMIQRTAQVHATLALAAATAMGTNMAHVDAVAWDKAAGASLPIDRQQP